jgi:hypothetical protein
VSVVIYCQIHIFVMNCELNWRKTRTLHYYHIYVYTVVRHNKSVIALEYVRRHPSTETTFMAPKMRQNSHVQQCRISKIFWGTIDPRTVRSEHGREIMHLPHWEEWIKWGKGRTLDRHPQLGEADRFTLLYIKTCFSLHICTCFEIWVFFNERALHAARLVAYVGLIAYSCRGRPRTAFPLVFTQI